MLRNLKADLESLTQLMEELKALGPHAESDDQIDNCERKAHESTNKLDQLAREKVHPQQGELV